MDRDHGVYIGWITSWRKWKKAWCEDEDDAIVSFDLSFLSKHRRYEPSHHADFVSLLADTFPKVKTDKQGTIELSTGSAIMKTISVLHVDRGFGIVTLRMSLCTRPDLLRIALLIESAGHRLLYETRPTISLLPYRDDPVWDIIRHCRQPSADFALAHRPDT
ncbi:FirrV-1-A9 [Feldmannia irregularis virus a]|uniref:FirrV-1-A9 n=1 Tax=Feldmannia irregularis virus a TaxID=231992 RepID=Q6XM78_9PHYC|nr:FirrV-1-A9 [Feldmannia irregularis virus a]AAR26833.1 FirrV-1-A9 [Feldmannia irregularis virus a]